MKQRELSSYNFNFRSSYASGKCPYVFKERNGSSEMCRIASCENPNPTQSSEVEYYPVFRCDAPSNWDETKNDLFYHDTIHFERPNGE